MMPPGCLSSVLQKHCFLSLFVYACSTESTALNTTDWLRMLNSLLYSCSLSLLRKTQMGFSWRTFLYLLILSVHSVPGSPGSLFLVLEGQVCFECVFGNLNISEMGGVIAIYVDDASCWGGIGGIINARSSLLISPHPNYSDGRVSHVCCISMEKVLHPAQASVSESRCYTGLVST